MRPQRSSTSVDAVSNSCSLLSKRITDPAEVFSRSRRISARLGWTHPEVARFITGAGFELLDMPGGLASAP